MIPTSSMEFIDTSLFESSMFELSYKDPTQKWLIRNHFQKFLQDFPSFIPSTDKYVHFDGTTMNLLNVSGFLHVSDHLPDVPLIIWVHENYPFMPPMIFIPSNRKCPLHKNHSFVDSCGVVTPPCMLNWDQRKNNLCDLAHNLVSLFRRDHPFMSIPTLKETIMDDLSTRIYQDLGDLSARNQHEIDKWSTLQAKLQEKGDDLDGYICNVEGELYSLENRVVDLKEYNDKLLKWLTHIQNMAPMANVEIVGEKSKMVDCRAANKAIDDVMYSLDKALEQGVIELDVYMKQVRVLAREQYFERAMLLKLKTSTSKS